MAATKHPLGLYAAGVLLIALAAAGWYIVQLRERIARLEGARRAERSLAPPAVAPAPTVIAQVPVSNGRTLTPPQRAAMLEKLGGAQGGRGKLVWFAMVTTNPEAVVFQRTLQNVFEAAGWQIKSVAPVRFALKPGVFVFSADEEPPDYVQQVLDAFEAAGITVTAGRGYRDFYREKKAENPSWVGFDMDVDQTYVVVIGRQPEAVATPP